MNPSTSDAGNQPNARPERHRGRIFADHVSRLSKLARRHDKQLMIWADFALKHPEEIARLGRDVVLMDWWYEARFDFDRIKGLRRKGFEVWVCPGTSSWNCLFPRVANAAQNISNWADAGRRHGATGLLNTDWGDFGHYNALGVSFHGYAWGAQQAWSGGLEEAEFDRAFARKVFGENSPRIAQIYRRLGDVHDAGFPIANGSALQYLYFDPLGPSFFLQHAKRSALEASARKLARAAKQAEQLGLDTTNDANSDASSDFTRLARNEIGWAIEATAIAIEKTLAAIEYNAWRAAAKDRRATKAGSKRIEGGNPPMDARGRRALAKRIDTLVDRQQTSLEDLRALWLARSAPSEFYKTEKRARASIASLKVAALCLRQNRPPRPPRPTRIGMLDVFNEVRRAFGMAPR